MGRRHTVRVQRPWEAAMEDQRREKRRRADVLGQIMTRAKTAVFCRVVDLSTGGARLKTSQAPVIPDHFELELPSEGVRRPSEVRWRKGTEIGVKFKEP
jgi:hypothetical protein